MWWRRLRGLSHSPSPAPGKKSTLFLVLALFLFFIFFGTEVLEARDCVLVTMHVYSAHILLSGKFIFFRILVLHGARCLRCLFNAVDVAHARGDERHAGFAACWGGQVS